MHSILKFIPAKLFKADLRVTTKDHFLTIAWKEPIKLVAFQLAVKKINLKENDSYPDLTLSHPFMAKTQSTNYAFSSVKGVELINVGLISAKTQQTPLVNNLTIELVHTPVVNCDDASNTSYKLCLFAPKHELYYLDPAIEDCQTPDAPLNGRLIAFDVSNGSRQANYSCDEGFKIRTDFVNSKTNFCESEGDWSNYNLEELCLPDTCRIASLAYPVKMPVFPIKDGKVEIGIKLFLACAHHNEVSFVNCLPGGNWSNPSSDCFVERSPFNEGILFLSIVNWVVIIFLSVSVGYLFYQLRKMKLPLNNNNRAPANGLKFDRNLSQEPILFESGL